MPVLTQYSRGERVCRVLEDRQTPKVAVPTFGVSTTTVHKWIARFRAEGVAGLENRPSRAPQSTEPYPGADWEYLNVAMDDHSRICFAGMMPTKPPAARSPFLQAAIAYYRSLSMTVESVMTDNGLCIPPGPFASLVLCWTSGTSVPGPTLPEPTARPSTSYRSRSGSGPIQSSAGHPWNTTTVTGPDSPLQLAPTLSQSQGQGTHQQIWSK